MNTLSHLEGLSKNWWGFLMRGALAILFGIMAFAVPGQTLISLALIYGAYALVDGILAIWFGMRSRASGIGVFGVLGIVAGVFTLFFPWATAVGLIYVIAAWALIRGVSEIVTAIQLRNEIAGEWSLILGGVISIALSALLFSNPGAGALAAVWAIGAYALVSGAMWIKLAFRVRRLHERVDPFAKAA